MSSKPSKPAASSANKAYLIAYNAVSCGLWATILYRTVTIAGTEGKYAQLFGETGEFVKWAQTAAMMEIVHSVLGE
jgi:very-long-chain (3R)-3-hydroxyacyl-CoA dehydratase